MRSPLFVFHTGYFSQPPSRYEGRSLLFVPRFVSVRERQRGYPISPRRSAGLNFTDAEGRMRIMATVSISTGNVWDRSSDSPSDYEMPKDLDSVQRICNLYLKELKEIVKNPSSFALTSLLGYVSFLSNIAFSGNTLAGNNAKPVTDAWKFKRFVNVYMWPNQGRKKEIDALYHVLRCGLAHSMSLYGTINAFSKRKRMSLSECRKQLLTNDAFLSEFHMSFPKVIIVNSPAAIKQSADEYYFCPQFLLSDVEKATNTLFQAAKSDTLLERRILDCIRIHPPIIPRDDYCFIQNGEA